MKEFKDALMIAIKELVIKVEIAVKEFLRIALLGGISYLITDGVELLVNLIGMKIQLDPSMKLIISGTLTSALKAVDKQLHENAKKQPEDDRNTGFMGIKGLTGF